MSQFEHALEKEPTITKPHSTVLQRCAFRIMYHWQWIFFGIASVTLAATILMLIVWVVAGREAILLPPVAIGTATPAALMGFSIGILPWQHERPAPPWVIITALSLAEDHKRALLADMLHQTVKSEWRGGPIDYGELFAIVKLVRRGFDAPLKRPPTNASTIWDSQVAAIQRIAYAERDTLGR